MNTIQSIPLYDHLSSIYPEFKDPTSSTRLQWLFTESTEDNEYTDQLYQTFWQNVILDCNLDGRLGSTHYHLAMDLERLDELLYRQDLGKAVLLPRVLDGLKRTQDLLTLEEFTTTFTPTSSWLERMVNVVTRNPTRWPISPLDPVHVCIPSLATIATHILTKSRPVSPIDYVLTFYEFKTIHGMYNDIQLTDPDLWLLLRYMNAKQGIAVDLDVRGYGRSHVAIKFPDRDEKSLAAIPADIHQSDRAIISLKTTCKALHDQVNALQLKMTSLIKQSLDHSSKQQKPQALYALGRKHQLEQILNRRLKSLETMETLLLKIDASHSDIQIIQAFNRGVDALKAIFNDNQLTVTSVDETMWRMQATLEKQEQMEDAIANGLDQGSTPKEKRAHDELEDELLTEVAPELTRAKRITPATSTREKNNSAAPELPTAPKSELARLQSILTTMPQTPNSPPRPKQRRLRQLA